MNQTLRSQDKFRGCLLGGAIGDALGWPIEFTTRIEIKELFGDEGIQDLVLNNKGLAEITDDTQLSLFTAEGILSDDPMGVYHAYLHWLQTQGYRNNFQVKTTISWLVSVPELHVRRAPGLTCVKALQSQKCGTINEPINNSKGCGAVMRVAPVGLFYKPEVAFNKGVEFAAITHGHPLGYLSAGAFSYLIANIMEGDSLRTAIMSTLQKLSQYDEAKDCSTVIKRAYDLSLSDTHPREAVEDLGLGFVGEEALAIGIYCALKFTDNFESALINAVNHDGDSDSTGSITGNILGAYLGIDKIPQSWIDKIELRDVIIQVADELWMKYKENNESLSRFFH